VLGAIVAQAVARGGLQMSPSALFFGNLAYAALAVVIFMAFRPAADQSR
jgi:hypothetical protein